MGRFSVRLTGTHDGAPSKPHARFDLFSVVALLLLAIVAGESIIAIFGLHYPNIFE